MLPEYTGEKLSMTFPSELISIQLSCNIRHVAVRGSAKTVSLAELNALLQDRVTVIHRFAKELLMVASRVNK